MWKPNISRLSYYLVVILLLLSRMKSRSRKEATEVDSVVSEIVSSLGVNIGNEFLKSFIIKRDKVIDVTV